jgi:hypothetical protein
VVPSVSFIDLTSTHIAGRLTADSCARPSFNRDIIAGLDHVLATARHEVVGAGGRTVSRIRIAKSKAEDHVLVLILIFKELVSEIDLRKRSVFTGTSAGRDPHDQLAPARTFSVFGSLIFGSSCSWWSYGGINELTWRVLLCDNRRGHADRPKEASCGPGGRLRSHNPRSQPGRGRAREGGGSVRVGAHATTAGGPIARRI